MEIKKSLTKFYKWEYFWLIVIIITTLLIHFSIVNRPNFPFFDEDHYVKGAQKIILEHYDLHPDHPPLGKLFVVLGVKIFGDNQMGWRFFSIIFGSIIIVLFYLICRKLGLSRTTSSIATFILGFENMTFVQSSVAMLDVYLYALMLASFLFYLHDKYYATGIFIALCSLIKLNGAFTALAIFVHWLFIKKRRTWKLLIAAIIAPISFLALFPIFDFLVYLQFLNPILRIKEMLTLGSSLTFATTIHEYLTRPWEWVLKYSSIPYLYHPRYEGAVSQSIWILIIPIFLYLIYRSIQGNDAAMFGLSWFIFTYIIWIPISILTDRVSYVYYFYPAIGAICLGIGVLIEELFSIFLKKRTKYYSLFIFFLCIYLIIHFINFVELSTFFSYF
jgi:dolichyl-phosphate-mannose-protein mannosyltransferase